MCSQISASLQHGCSVKFNNKWFSRHMCETNLKRFFLLSSFPTCFGAIFKVSEIMFSLIFLELGAALMRKFNLTEFWF